MNTPPLFSIIIPTHNRAKHIGVAIQSVLDQVFEDWELIIIDDGSTDETRKVVLAFKLKKVNYFYQNHAERSSARNLGISKAKGIYICFLDDDDFFLPNHLRNLAAKINKENFQKAIFRVGMYTLTNGIRKKIPNYSNDQQVHPALFFLNQMAGIHSLCFHRSILLNYQFDTRWKHFQDTHLLIRALLDYPFHQIDQYTAVYMIYDEMGSRKVFKQANATERTENNIAAIKDLFLEGGMKLQSIVGKKLEKDIIAQKYLDHSYGALWAGKKKLAIENFKKALTSRSELKWWPQYAKFLLKWILA